jgi:polysaccharide pyruvyl transferase WcaK-like protein
VAGKYPEFDKDDKGTSLVLVNTYRGGELLDSCRRLLFLGSADMDAALEGNRMLKSPAESPPERDTFYTDLVADDFSAFLKKYQLVPLSQLIQIKNRLLNKLHGPFLRSIKSAFKSVLSSIVYQLSLPGIRGKKRNLPDSLLILPAADGWEGNRPHGFGDEMLMLGLLDGLKGRFSGSITALSMNGCGVRAINFFGHPLKVVGFPKGWLSVNACRHFASISRAHTHFAVIGADVLDGAYGIAASVQRLRFVNIAARMGLATASTGCSFNGTRNNKILRLLKSAEKSGLILYARDEVSKLRLSDILANVGLVADLAYCVRDGEFPVPPRIGTLQVAVESWRTCGGFVIGINMCGWHIKDQDAFIDSLVNSLSLLENSQKKLGLIPLPHDTRPESVSDVEILYKLHAKVGTRFKILCPPDDIQSGIDAKQAVSLCDVLLTGRMHLAISAHDQGIPAISFGYQGKFEGFYQQYGLGKEWVFNYDDPGAAVRFLDAVLCRRQEYSAMLLQKKSAVHEAAKRNFAWLDQ